MPKFSNESLLVIPQLHHHLQAVMFSAIEYIDFKLICGYRSKEAQDLAFEKGFSTLKFPDSKHNKFPSLAVDVVPFHKQAPHIRWTDEKSFYLLAGYIKACADTLNIRIRWGGNWQKGNDYQHINESEKKRFIDLPHYELIQE